MRVTSVMFAFLLFTAAGSAQAPAPAKPAAPATAKPAAPAAARASGNRAAGTLLQVMRGILFPASNIIFLAQDTDPTKTPATPAEAKFGNPYAGWVNVENAAIAIGEAANLLTLPRMCSNGKPAPITRADWPKFVQGLREASAVAYKAAQSKNMDNIVDAAGTVTEACSACHDKYREKPNLSLRCTP